MPIREIITLGHPALWKKSEKVNEVKNDSVKTLVADLRDTLIDFRERNGFGRGIAAPQVNALKRAIYVVMPDGSFEGPLINPEIVATEGDLVPVWDDCFSLPGLKVKVPRLPKIRVEYLDEKGQKNTIKAAGGLAELLQHEIDHLDGILATDRAASPRDLVSDADDKQTIQEILDAAEVGYLGVLTPDGFPRVVPFNFVRVGEILYVHGANEGEKYESLKVSDKVTFHANIPLSVIPSYWISVKSAGGATQFFKSVQINGRAFFVPILIIYKDLNTVNINS